MVTFIHTHDVAKDARLFLLRLQFFPPGFLHLPVSPFFHFSDATDAKMDASFERLN